MARRKRLPKLDVCKVNLKRMRKLSSAQLMNVWARLGASAPSRTNANSLLKGIVSNLAAAKSSSKYHAGDHKQKRHAQKVYLGITKRLEGEFRALQSKKCKR